MLIIRRFENPSFQDYEKTWEKMQRFTDERTADTPDELWCLQHTGVYTQGLAGKSEHVIAPENIPIVQSDRGGQITYHGPGQLVVYTLLDLKRLNIGVRTLVTSLEDCIIALLKEYGIESEGNRDAPGVYVNQDKICSIGLRVRRGCSFHGLALNVNMNMKPFTGIRPCGLNVNVTQTKDQGGPAQINQAIDDFLPHFRQKFGYNEAIIHNE